MANPLATQLDYIQFILGLALLLLGAVCVSRSRAGPLPTPWWLLAAFSFLHGMAEWLALVAVARGDSPRYGLARTAIVAAAFLVLLEFTRRSRRMVRGWTPGPWIHLVPLILVSGALLAYGPGVFEAAVRLALAGPASLWTGGLFLVASARATGLAGGAASRRARWWGGVYFLGFAVAAGLIVPAAPFLPAAWPTAEAFLTGTGVHVQLVRGMLVYGIALSVWALNVSFDHRGRLLQKQRLLFWVMAASTAALVVAGWSFTNWLGRQGEQDLLEEAEASATQLQERLSGDLHDAEGGARAMAGLLDRLRAPGERLDPATLEHVVVSQALASEGLVVYVLDPAGAVLATSDRHRLDAQSRKSFGSRPYFQEAMAGKAGRFFGTGVVDGRAGYYAAEPVRDREGRVVAVAVVKHTLTPAQLAGARAEEAFIASPDGHILVASRPGRERQLLWLAEAPAGPGPRNGLEPIPAILDHEVVGTERVWSDGKERIAVRRPLPDLEWSLVVLRSGRFQVAGRLLGIVITLLVCSLVLGAFVAMQRQLQAESQISDRRREAEGRAREYARKADTDALTGVLNRLGLNGTFSREFERARRYRQPLSVVILDIDHFKRVNDEHGHVAGDGVLVAVARLLEGNVRDSDCVARWGGEEFVVVAPMTEAQGGLQLAEKLRARLESTPLPPVGVVTASFGVAELHPGEGIEALLHRADEALYRAKSSGRNRVECAPAAAVGPRDPGTVAAEAGRGEAEAALIYDDTGFAPIDREHRALGEALVAFVEKVKAGDLAGIQAALESIAEEVTAHFAHEEALMEAHAFPLRERHQEAHALFLGDVRLYLDELDQGGLTMNFRRWATRRLLEWFRYHVVAHDAALGQHLREAGSGARPAGPEDG